MSSDPRTTTDRCPGALTLHQAADGALARVRLPGGMVDPSHMQVLAKAAGDVGNGSMQLTSRGNIQFRGVRDSTELARRLADAGMLPSPSHERVRNILASPLTGRVNGVTDVRTLITALDRGLCACAELADLPGRTLFALDDGRGDVTALDPDFGVQALSPELFALILGGADTGVRVDRESVVDVLVDAARIFVLLRGTEWRLTELADGPARVLATLGLDSSGYDPTSTSPLATRPSNTPPIGWLSQGDGLVALGGVLALGVLDARLAEFLAAIDKPLVVTPWRGIVVCDLDEGAAEQVVRVLAPMGLIFDADSPWVNLSACTGAPGCEKSNADVRGDLLDAVAAGRNLADQREHWSGCERRCGRPKGEIVDVVAIGTGYRVS